MDVPLEEEKGMKEVKSKDLAASGGPTIRTVRVMTANTRLKHGQTIWINLRAESNICGILIWEIHLQTFTEGLTDKDTVMSVASKETWQGGTAVWSHTKLDGLSSTLHPCLLWVMSSSMIVNMGMMRIEESGYGPSS